MVFPEAGIGSRLFPAELAGFLNSYYGQKGVEVLAGQRAVGLESRGHRLIRPSAAPRPSTSGSRSTASWRGSGSNRTSNWPGLPV